MLCFEPSARLADASMSGDSGMAAQPAKHVENPNAAVSDQITRMTKPLLVLLVQRPERLERDSAEGEVRKR